jgi:hypothetical protein
MQFQPIEKRSGLEVPNYDISLETHIGLLSTGDILARRGNFDDCDLVVMSSEETLRTGQNVPHHDCRSQRENQVFVVRVQQKTPTY